MRSASASRTPLVFAPSRKIDFCFAISSGFFLPIARRSQIGAAERVARERLRNLHDLLLVDDDAVRRHKQLVDERVHLADGLAAVLSG